MAKPSACIHLRWATVSLNDGLALFFLFCRVEKGLKKAKEVEEAAALPRKEATNAQLQRHVFFYQRQMYGCRAWYFRVTCLRLSYSGLKDTQTILPHGH